MDRDRSDERKVEQGARSDAHGVERKDASIGGACRRTDLRCNQCYQDADFGEIL